MTLAQIGTAVVGFSLLSSVFRGNQGRELVRFMTFRDVAEIGMIATIGSLLPQVLGAVGADEPARWRWAGAGFGILYVAGFSGSLRRKSRHHALGQVLGRRWGTSATILSILLATLLLIGFNLVSPSQASGGRHVLAVVLTLSAAGLLFLRAAFDDDLE